MTRRLPSLRRTRLRPRLAALAVTLLGALALIAPEAGRASEPLLYEGQPIHPACIHALVMKEADRIPVTVSVSLRGCARSLRSAIPTRYDGRIATFEIPELLGGGGSFGYRSLRRLDNGIHVLAIWRYRAEGKAEMSLAAVAFRERPVLTSGVVTRIAVLDLLGEVWIPNAQVKTLRSVGNVVHVKVGTGEEAFERHVDFTELGKAHGK